MKRIELACGHTATVSKAAVRRALLVNQHRAWCYTCQANEFIRRVS